MRVTAGQPQPAAAAAARPEGEGRSRSPRASPPAPARPSGKLVLRAEAAVEHARQAPERSILLVRKETQPRRRRRHAPGRGHPHQHRRHDEPRGRRRPRLGQALRRRLRGGQDRREGRRRSQVGGKTVNARATFITIDGTTGEVMVGKVADASTPKLTGDFATRDELGRQVPHAEDPHQRRHAGRRQARPASSAPKASACAAPSTCSSTATASTPCGR